LKVATQLMCAFYGSSHSETDCRAGARNDGIVIKRFINRTIAFVTDKTTIILSINLV